MSFHNYQDDTDVPWQEDEVALTIELNKQNNKGNNMSTFADKFKSLKAAQVTDNVEAYEEKGTIGSGGSKFKIEEDGVYTVLVDMVTFHESKSSKSCWYELTLKTEGGAKIKQKMFVINSDGLISRVDKDGRTRQNPDYARMSGINFLLTGEWDGLPNIEEREVMVYDHSAGAEIAKTLPIVPSFIGKPLAVTVKMLLEDGYPDATQSRLVPDIRNFLDPVTLKSATETRNNSEATVVEQFKESIAKNSAPIDKRDKSKGNNAGSQASAPRPSSSSFSFSK